MAAVFVNTGKVLTIEAPFSNKPEEKSAMPAMPGGRMDFWLADGSG